MDRDIDTIYKQIGGVKITPMGADPDDTDSSVHQYNFGVGGRPGCAGPTVATASPNLYDIAPHTAGRWDGKTTICLPEIARKTLGDFLKPHAQKSGTCGGHAGSRCAENTQPIMIAAGARATFRTVSHAWLYYLARREYGMLGSGDGVPDGSIPVVAGKYGLLNREEAGDNHQDGGSVDAVADKWGGRGGAPANLAALAVDNVVQFSAKLNSFAEVMDAFASGGAVVVSDASGFTMNRDKNGMCSRRGTWYHYHNLNGGGLLATGQKFCSYEQSWGQNVPDGPLLGDGAFPSHCFGITEDAVNEMCRGGSVQAFFGFALWDQSAVPDIDWSKYF